MVRSSALSPDTHTGKSRGPTDPTAKPRRNPREKTLEAKYREDSVRSSTNISKTFFSGLFTKYPPWGWTVDSVVNSSCYFLQKSGSIPSTHNKLLTTTSNSSSRDLMPLLVSADSYMYVMHIYTLRHTHTQESIIPCISNLFLTLRARRTFKIKYVKCQIDWYFTATWFILICKIYKIQTEERNHHSKCFLKNTSMNRN